MKYIDFDDVIKATGQILFNEYDCVRVNGSEDEIIKFIQKFDWEWLLRVSPIINDSVDVIKTSSDVAILTKIHSMDNEGVAKIKDIRNMGIKCEIILCPYQMKKIDMVDPRNNILVDDNITNLDEWDSLGGLSIYFNKDFNDIDGYGRKNTKYIKTRSLDILKKY